MSSISPRVTLTCCESTLPQNIDTYIFLFLGVLTVVHLGVHRGDCIGVRVVWAGVTGIVGWDFGVDGFEQVW